MARKSKIVRCPTCGRKQVRSTESNRRYWALLHVVAETVKPKGVQYSSEVWHEYMKLRYLGGETIALPNGKTMVQPNSSADLETHGNTDTGQIGFTEYMMMVEVWANEHGAHLPE